MTILRIKKKKTKILALIIATLLLAACGQDEGRSRGGIEVGGPAPDFSLTDLDGRQWKLSELRGKVVFINFWATWCPPCMGEMPSMQALHEGMPPESFQMLGLLYNDRPEFARNLMKKIGLGFPVLVDQENQIATAYGITGVPETFLVDAEGIVREKIIGPQDWNAPEARELMKRYLPAAKP